MYVALGEDRTLQQLAEVTGYGLQTLNNKSSVGKWKLRLQELEDSQESLITAYVTDIQNEVRISEAVVYRGASERILEILRDSLPLLKPTDSPRDLKTLLDTYRLIQGQATSIETVQTKELKEEDLEGFSPAELEKMLNLYA